MKPIEDQPPPRVGGQEIWPLVLSDLREHLGPPGLALGVIRSPADLGAFYLEGQARHLLGMQRYGLALAAGNGRNALADAAQEALDLCAYLRQAIEESKIAGVLDLELVRDYTAALCLACRVLDRHAERNPA